MAAPFSHFDAWEMNATCFQGSIFIEENHSNKLSSREEQHSQQTPFGTPSQSLMSYWGYKFETLSLLPQPWYPTSREYIESREDQIVNNHAQYCSVARTGYGKVKMIIGGEVDAGTVLFRPINWVELKTSAIIRNERDQTKFERKLLKFWIQSFLIGVPKIIVGFRDENGILQKLEELEVQSIPEKVKSQGRNLWDGNTCINFAASFLECMRLRLLNHITLTHWIGLKTIITEDGVWRIRKRGKIPTLELYQLEETGHGDVLSENFVQWRTSGPSHDVTTRSSTPHLPENTNGSVIGMPHPPWEPNSSTGGDSAHVAG